MGMDLEKYLLDAVGKEKDEITQDNPFRDFGFDGDKKRLGWVKPVEFTKIKSRLEELIPLIEGKESFIFIGMGGSINGIKPLINLFGAKSFYTLDNLDPKALSEIINKINDLSKTLIVAISKSGTTKETQLLATSLKEAFFAKSSELKWQDHFLWLSDITSFDKLDSLGWSGAKKTPIQFDDDNDIGGRFSSPTTLIFFLPLFLLLNKDFSKLQELYAEFSQIQGEIRLKAYTLCAACKDKLKAYFSPNIEEKFGESFSSWIVQLFQESLGSKIPGLAVKTIPNYGGNEFFPLKLDMNIGNSSISLMAHMYFFQIFVAYYSAVKKLNFVTQDRVEKYKKEMQRLEESGIEKNKIETLDLEKVAEKIKIMAKSEHRFIEVVLYFKPALDLIEKIKQVLKQYLPDKEVLIFIGSDWNHQSYQAAFGSQDTFYALLIQEYKTEVQLIAKETIFRNIETQIIIAQATYHTLEDKALISSLLSD